MNIPSNIQIVQDMERALVVLRQVGQWMLDTGMNPSQWWHPDNMNQQFFSEYTQPDEFYVALVDDVPAAAQIVQWTQRNQDWSGIDGDQSPAALYVHWLCVDRAFAGRGLPKIMIDVAEDLARDNNTSLLRVDTTASEEKLCGIYEKLGFLLVGTLGEEYRTTAFYQKEIKAISR